MLEFSAGAIWRSQGLEMKGVLGERPTEVEE